MPRIPHAHAHTSVGFSTGGRLMRPMFFLAFCPLGPFIAPAVTTQLRFIRPRAVVKPGTC